MTEREKVELLMSGVRFECELCKGECIGERIPFNWFTYRWCGVCIDKYQLHAYSELKRYRLPLEISE